MTPTKAKARPKPRATADPVGLVEIAARLGVAQNTVSQWRNRHPGFPAPRWVVSTYPAWDWSDIAKWAKATGRLA